VYTQDGKVNLDLGGVIEIVKARLAEKGITLFENVTKAQSGISILNGLATWLPLIALVLWAAAIWASNSRTAALLWIGLGLATGMTILLVAAAISQGYYLDAAEAAGNVDMPAATSFFDIIMGSLKTAIRGTFAFGLLLAAAGVALALIVLVAMDQPSLLRALLVSLFLAAYLGILEFLSSKAAQK